MSISNQYLIRQIRSLGNGGWEKAFFADFLISTGPGNRSIPVWYTKQLKKLILTCNCKFCKKSILSYDLVMEGWPSG